MLKEQILRFSQNPECIAQDHAALVGVLNYVQRTGKDYTKLSVEDLRVIFSTYNSTDEKGIRRYLIGIQKFISWVKQQGIDVQALQESVNQFVEESKYHSLSFHKEWHYGSYASMIESFRQFANQSNLSDPEKYAAYLTLAWFGVPRSVSFNILEKDIVEEPGAFIVKDVVRIRNPLAIEVLSSYLHSDGYYSKDNRYYKRKPSEYYLKKSNGIPRYLAQANKELENYDHYFSYEEVAMSAMFVKCHDALRALEIPITMNTYKTHTRIIVGLLNLPDTFYEYKSIVGYITFYDWCKVFRSVDDYAPST